MARTAVRATVVIRKLTSASWCTPALGTEIALRPKAPMAENPKLLPQLAEARAQTDLLFQHLDPAALYGRPIAERHRMVFYLGHLEAFDWNQMKHTGMHSASPNPEFDSLFALGIDPEPGRLPHDQPSDWPKLPEILSYNQGVRNTIDSFLPQVSADTIQMMIEHRHMHAETFAYILHNLEFEKKRGPSEPLTVTPPVYQEFVDIPSGLATLGRDAAEGFGWDNEFRKFSVSAASFQITKFKVTNGEFLEFMKLTGARAPYYWFQQESQWFYRGMFQNFPLPLNWPVYCTWEQASDYAKFRKLLLPTEAQFHRAAFGVPDGAPERELPWGNGGMDFRKQGNFGYAAWNPVAVNASPETESAFGVAQVVGNGWEWTSTVFAPFDGFEPHPTYPTYSANFFDNSHYVMKGASPRTSAALIRRSLRNWFRPEYPYVYATFHLVRN